MMKSVTILATAALFSGALAFAGPCDRTLTKGSLNAQESSDMARTGLGHRDVKVGDYFVSYIFAEANFDAELAMGIYTSCGEHAGADGLGTFITKSEMKSADNANPFQVYYEQAGMFFWTGGEYQVENTVSMDGSSYLMTTRLVSASDSAFSPKAADGYVRMIPEGASKVFVIACNYMQPKNPPWGSTSKYNDTAKQRLSMSGQNLLAWVKRVSQGQGSRSADDYRQHIRTLLGQ